jgi:hypothetical protein
MVGDIESVDIRRVGKQEGAVAAADAESIFIGRRSVNVEPEKREKGS